MILTATPYRVSLFGGGTDYPAWYREHGGLVVGMAIDKYCYIGVNRAPPGQGCRYRIVYSKIEDRDRIEDIVHPGARGVLYHLGVHEPITITHFGDLPSGGGLGASSAYVVGLLRAVRALQSSYNAPDMPNSYDLAQEAIHVERNVIGEAVGDQDQLFATYGGLRCFKFGTNGSITTAPICLSRSLNNELFDPLVLVYTGTMRYAHEMAVKVIAEIPNRQTQLRELAALAEEGRGVLEYGTLTEFAGLLNESWWLKRELHREISPPIVDALYDHGRACGALGGKLLGAGGGGFMLFVVPHEHRARFEQDIGVPCVHFGLAPVGCRTVIDG